MATEVIEHLRRVVLLRDGAGLTDGQLLDDYLGRRDPAALAALVRRHAPMVWGVCRRILASHHDAEDAFQATFLVLVRRAASIAARERLANWLYGVARQTALKARATVAKRARRERQVTALPQPARAEPDCTIDLQLILDAELSRLPDEHRVVLILCDLEGKTRKEAARQLGLPEGTVASRLARARVILARRLTRRGVALSGGALAALLWRDVASGCVPSSVVTSAVNVACAGAVVATGAIPPRVAALTEGVLRTMFLTKLKNTTALLLVLAVGTGGAGAGGLLRQTKAAEQPGAPKQPAAAANPKRPAPPSVREIALRFGMTDIQAFLFAEAWQGRRQGESVYDVALRFGLSDIQAFLFAEAWQSEHPAPRSGAIGSPAGKDHEFKNRLMDLDEHWWKGDVATLCRLAADDIITVSGVGRYDKACLLEAARNRHPVDWTRRDVEVSRVSNDVAVVTYRYDCKVVRSDGTLFQNCRDRRLSMTWANRQGRWVVVFVHETILPGGE